MEGLKNKRHNILRTRLLLAGCALLLGCLISGCKPKPTVAAPDSGVSVPSGDGYFQTPFHEESQFIVQDIVSDLAEQIYYAALNHLPDPKTFSVTATENGDSPKDAPVYTVQVQLDPARKVVVCQVNVNGPIWSPAVYQGVATDLAQAVGLKAGASDITDDTSLLAKLTDGSPETIERENQRVSSALNDNFTSPELHEQAAVLLGAFLMRDHSGRFNETLSPLSRLTTQLAVAQLLRGPGAAGINGRIAEAMMLTVVDDEAAALNCLNAIGNTNVEVVPWIRALQTRATGDYRTLDKMDNLSRVEIVEWFNAYADYVSTPLAWPKLTDDQRQTIDFVRVADEEGYSVEMGHQLLDAAIPLELHEIDSVYNLSHPEKFRPAGLVAALNVLPGHGFETDSNGGVQVRVIGWGQWADFLQRHLCHAIQQNFHFMNALWGVPDDAKAFASQCEQSYGGLRLYPFVRRYNCTDAGAYHRSVDDGFKVTVASPQLVPADGWNYLCYDVPFAPSYHPNPNPHVNEWHNHNPPPGTIYDLNPRLFHPSLVGRADVIARFEKLHEMAPYDCRISSYLLKHKYNNQPTYDQAMDLFKSVLPYSTFAMGSVADTVYDQPQRYEKLMLQAAALNPVFYYTLGDYEIDRQEEDQAAQYFDDACENDPDSVRVSNYATWRVRYYLKHGQAEKARELAQTAGEVYSARGLQAQATYFELTSNYDGAFEWYAKDEERYEDSWPVVSFCQRYKHLTGDTRFEPEIAKRVTKIFPAGEEKVAVADFHDAPTDGVSINGQSLLLTQAGLRTGDVIVAINGTRAHSYNQYMFIRDSLETPELDLIVWQGSGYHEVRSAPPNHLFGVQFGNYKPR